MGYFLGPASEIYRIPRVKSTRGHFGASEIYRLTPLSASEIYRGRKQHRAKPFSP